LAVGPSGLKKEQESYWALLPSVGRITRWFLKDMRIDDDRLELRGWGDSSRVLSCYWALGLVGASIHFAEYKLLKLLGSGLFSASVINSECQSVITPECELLVSQ